MVPLQVMPVGAFLFGGAPARDFLSQEKRGRFIPLLTGIAPTSRKSAGGSTAPQDMLLGRRDAHGHFPNSHALGQANWVFRLVADHIN